MEEPHLAAAAAAAAVVAVPASAQVYLGADPGGAGVQVGPFESFGGPRHGYRDYGPGILCLRQRRLSRSESVSTPSGQVVIGKVAPRLLLT